MPKRTYVGSHDAVVLADGGLEVKNGETVDVSEETAREMDVSAAWAIPKSKGVKNGA